MKVGFLQTSHGQAQALCKSVALWYFYFMNMPPASSRRYSTYRELMQLKPDRWGLRGDPRLWDALYKELSDRAIPLSYSEFSKEILDEICAITGYDLTLEKEFLSVPQFIKGSGMSVGMISPSWWIDTCLPLLWQRVQS